MALPKTFEIVVTRRPQRQQVGGPSATQGLETQVSAAMDAADLAVGACTAMSPSDVTQWQGIYSAWKAWQAQYDKCSGLSLVVPWTDVECVAFWSGLQSGGAGNLQQYQQVAAQWQARVAQMCPNYSPPPGGPGSPSGPQPPAPSGGGGGGSGHPQCGFLDTLLGRCQQQSQQPCGWFDSLLGRCNQQDTTSWPGAIKWVALFGVFALAAWYAGPVLAAVGGAVAGGIRQRGAGEFGNMPVDRTPKPLAPPPVLETFQFGDVSADEVLSVLED